MNIVFIGMPGSGKTTIGKIFSKRLNLNFFDVDDYIEKKEKIKIFDIFKTYGEEYFRKIETKYLFEICKNDNSVISTGGGVITKKINMDILKKNGIIIFIDRSVEDILKENLLDRPLLQNIENLYNLYNDRIELYRKYSNIIIKNNGKFDDIIDEIIKKLNLR